MIVPFFFSRSVLLQVGQCAGISSTTTSRYSGFAIATGNDSSVFTAVRVIVTGFDSACDGGAHAGLSSVLRRGLFVLIGS